VGAGSQRIGSWYTDRRLEQGGVRSFVDPTLVIKPEGLTPW